jgi:anti-sigma factor RsiW
VSSTVGHKEHEHGTGDNLFPRAVWARSRHCESKEKLDKILYRSYQVVASKPAAPTFRACRGAMLGILSSGLDASRIPSSAVGAWWANPESNC